MSKQQQAVDLLRGLVEAKLAPPATASSLPVIIVAEQLTLHMPIFCAPVVPSPAE